MSSYNSKRLCRSRSYRSNAGAALNPLDSESDHSSENDVVELVESVELKLSAQANENISQHHTNVIVDDMDNVNNEELLFVEETQENIDIEIGSRELVLTAVLL